MAERQPEDTEKVSFLVAKKNLDMGLTIKKVEDLFDEKKVSKGDEPKNAIIDPKDSREVLAIALEVAMQRPRAEPLALETL